MMEIKYKKIETINEFIDAIRIRVDVFIIEQKFQPGWEPDEDDKNATHFIALEENRIVATARAREISENEFKIERMATRKEYRGKGIGKELVHFIIENLKNQNPTRIFMQSQVQAQKFYENCGFVATSEPYDLYGIQHIDMECKNQ